MADFDFSTLITDRSPEDLQALRDLLATPMADWTAAQRDAFNMAASKGAYNFTDFNRVLAAMQSINDQLAAMGYKTGFFRPRVPHQGDDATTDPSVYSYRYFRMRINAVRSGGEMQMSEIRLMDESGNFYQFPAGTTVSTTLEVSVAAESPANLIDGLVTTKYFCSSFAAGGTITIDLGDGQGADLLTWTKWQWYTANDVPNRDPVSFDFEASHNGSDWVTLDSVTDASITQDREALAYAGDLDIIRPVELPEGYTQVEYIQSSGAQYIDTGFKPNQDTSVTTKLLGAGNSTPTWFFGSRDGAGVNAYGFMVSTQYRSDYGGNGTMFSIGGLDAFEIEKLKNVTYINKKVMATAQSTTFQCANTLYLLGMNQGGENSSPAINGVCMGPVIVLDGETLVRNLVPCKDPAGNVGMYDLVGAQFYGNAGTGAFTAGPDVPPAPEPEPERDPYLWYEDDVPTPTAVRPYLANVGIIKGIFPLPKELPEVPDDMDRMTQDEANAIEQILAAAARYIEPQQMIYLRSGAAICGDNLYFQN